MPGIHVRDRERLVDERGDPERAEHHYQAALKQHGIDPGPMPAAAPTTAAPSAAQNASSPEPTAAGSSTPSSDVGDGGS